ncbi:MAG: hypothetical protein ACTSYX_04925 [Candidatus Thorarchaeota archaeon]
MIDLLLLVLLVWSIFRVIEKVLDIVTKACRIVKNDWRNEKNGEEERNRT